MFDRCYFFSVLFNQLVHPVLLHYHRLRPPPPPPPPCPPPHRHHFASPQFPPSPRFVRSHFAICDAIAFIALTEDVYFFSNHALYSLFFAGIFYGFVQSFQSIHLITFVVASPFLVLRYSHPLSRLLHDRLASFSFDFDVSRCTQLERANTIVDI